MVNHLLALKMVGCVGLDLVSPYGKMGARRDVMGVVQGSHQQGEKHEYIF